MKLAGFGLLLSGWLIVVVAVAILPLLAEQSIFVVAGLLVETLGLFLVTRNSRPVAGGDE